MMYTVFFLLALICNISSARKLNVFDSDIFESFQTVAGNLGTSSSSGVAYAFDAFAASALATDVSNSDFFANGALAAIGGASNTEGGEATVEASNSLVSVVEDDFASTTLDSDITASANGEGIAAAAFQGVGEAGKNDGSTNAAFAIQGIAADEGEDAEATIVSDGYAYVNDDSAFSSATVCAGSNC